MRPISDIKTPRPRTIVIVAMGLAGWATTAIDANADGGLPKSHPLKTKRLEQARISADNQYVVGSDHRDNGSQWLTVFDFGSGVPLYTLQAKLAESSSDTPGQTEYLFWALAETADLLFVRRKSDGPIRVWDLKEQKFIHEIEVPEALEGRWFQAGLQTTPDGRFLLVRRNQHYHLFESES